MQIPPAPPADGKPAEVTAAVGWPGPADGYQVNFESRQIRQEERQRFK